MDPDIIRLEFPAANGVGTARGIAKLFGIMANGGEYDNKTLISRRFLDEYKYDKRELTGDLVLWDMPIRWKYGMHVIPEVGQVSGVILTTDLLKSIYRQLIWTEKCLLVLLLPFHPTLPTLPYHHVRPLPLPLLPLSLPSPPLPSNTPPHGFHFIVSRGSMSPSHYSRFKYYTE